MGDVAALKAKVGELVSPEAFGIAPVKRPGPPIGTPPPPGDGREPRAETLLEAVLPRLFDRLGAIEALLQKLTAPRAPPGAGPHAPSSMDYQLKMDLIDVLTDHPYASRSDRRAALLVGIDFAENPEGSPRVDITMIVSQIEKVDPPSLLRLLNNAVKGVGLTEMKDRLEAVKARVEQWIATRNG